MPSILLALFVTTVVVVTHAEPPLNVGLGDIGVGDGSYSTSGLGASYGAPSQDLVVTDIGSSIGSSYSDVSGLGGYNDVSSFGGYSSGGDIGLSSGGYDIGGGSDQGEIVATPAAKGVRYAGPIVYTNEKPPVIHFPPPPKPKKGGYGKGGKGGAKGQTIKYVPLPHHELPILIYQSDINPPIHVVSPPPGAIVDSPQVAYGPPKGDYGVPSAAPSSNVEYGVPPQAKISVGSSEYRPPKASYGPPKVTTLKAQYGPPKGDLKASYSAPKAVYGPPKKAAPLPHIIYAGHPPIHIFQQPPIYMSAPKAQASAPKAVYSSPPKASAKTQYGAPKGEHHVFKGHHGPSKDHGGLHSFHSSIHQSLKSHLGLAKSALNSFHSSLPSFKASIHAGHNGGGHSKGHSQKGKSSYIVAPKGWNKPPIIIYQGVRPPVTVYEKPAGGYDSGVSGSAPVASPVMYGAPHTLSPIALSQPVSAPLVLEAPLSQLSLDPHAHVAGTDAPGNPVAHNVDITYDIQRVSNEAGKFIDLRNRPQFATARSFWIPNSGMASIAGGQAQPALYISDLTQAGQFQVLRRSDILDHTILSGVSSLKAEQDKTLQLRSDLSVLPTSAPMQAAGTVINTPASAPAHIQTRMDVLPTFLAGGNEQSLSAIPVSFKSVIVAAAGAQNGASLGADPANESTSKSS